MMFHFRYRMSTNNQSTSSTDQEINRNHSITTDQSQNHSATSPDVEEIDAAQADQSDRYDIFR